MNNDQKLYKLFQKNKGILRFSAIVKAGFDPIYLKRLAAKGQIEKIGHGLYQLVDAPALSNPDLVTATLQSPKSVICLISALSFHQATDQVPHQIYLAIPVGSRANKISYPPIRFFYYASQSWEAGIETHKIDGREVRIYGLAKTIADCFKFRNKIGFDVAALCFEGSQADLTNTEKCQPALYVTSLAALEAFHDQWRKDSLVLDKWFAIQAMSRLPDTLARVRSLMKHPAFQLTNPNKVRALLGAFVGVGHEGLHHQGVAVIALTSVQDPSTSAW